MAVVRSILLAVEVATRGRDELVKKLAEEQKGLLFARGQLEQLQAYSGDTDARWTRAAQNSATPELMRHHYQFMGRLHHAISLQEGVINDLDRRVEMARARLLESEVRLNGLKRVLAIRQSEIASQQVRREQKQMDELAAVQFRRVLDEGLLEKLHEH